MARQYYVYGMGAALVDTEIEVSDQDLQDLKIEKGLMTLVDSDRHQYLTEHFTSTGHLTVSRKACGGSAANTVIALSYFGASGFFSCKVADDENGHIYLNGLAEAGVKTSATETLAKGDSGRCLVLISPDAERTMNTYLGASESFSIENIDFQAIEEAQFLYAESYLVTSETGWSAALAAFKAARENETKIALSLSDPGIVAHFKSGLEHVLSDGVDLLFCNLDEALAWTECADLESAAKALQASAKQFAITLGAEGALLYDGYEFHQVAAHPVSAVDTNGAGDMFAGAFMYGLSQDYSFKRCGEFACLAAATVVTHFGPRLHPFQHRELKQEFANSQ